MTQRNRILTEPDVLIVGGGIVGSAIFRECARNGLSVQLVESRDFGWDVSAGSTEMAHGGFRYLMALADWPLVFESLTERELLSVNAPHLVRHLNFYMPVYKGDGTTFDFCIPRVPCMPITVGGYFGAGMWMMQAGMILYKMFAALGLIMKGFPPNKDKIGYKKFKKAQMLKIAPQLNPDRLVGGFRFTDCKIEDVERLVIENILSAENYARKSGIAAEAANHAAAVKFETAPDGRVTKVEIKDAITAEVLFSRPKIVVNSTGVLIDRTLEKAGIGEGRELIRKVSGSHIVSPRFLKSPDLTEAYAFWIDKKILFLISKGRDRLLIGTTERDVEVGDGINHNRNFKADIDEITTKTKSRFPEYARDPEKDIYYTRVRPLLRQPGKTDPKAVSRRDLIQWSGKSPNTVSVSGKLGPARHLAEVAAKSILAKLKPGEKYATTHKDRYPGGDFEGGIVDCAAKLRAAWPDIDPVTLENVARRYGARHAGVLELAKEPRDLDKIVPQPDSQPLCALLFSFKTEHCASLSDAMSRTGTHKLFGQGLDGAAKAADYLGEKLGWDAATVKSEIEGYKAFIAERCDTI